MNQKNTTKIVINSQTFELLINNCEPLKANNPEGPKRLNKDALNNCLNFQIQSLAASVVKRAALGINREFKKRGWDGQVIAQIHDQLIIKIKKELAEEAKWVVKEIMETTTQLPGVTLKAPPEIAKNFRDGH